MSSGILKAIAKGIGYVLFFVAALVFFVYVTFPMDQVRGYVEYQAKRRLKMDVRIGDLALKGLSGVELWDVVIVLPEREPPKSEAPGAGGAEEAPLVRPGGPAVAAPPRPTEGGAAVAPTGGAAKVLQASAKEAKAAKKGADAAGDEAAGDDGDGTAKKKKSKGLAVKLDHVDVTVKLIDVLFGKNPDIEIDADLLGGSIKGARVRRDGKKIHIEAPDIAGLDLDKTPLLGYFTAGAMPLDLRGKLSGSVDFTWGGSLWDSKGTIEVALAQSSLREPEIKSKQYGDFRLTDVKTGALGVKATVGKKKDIAALRAVPGPKDATVIHLEKVEISGDDVELVTEERSLFVLRKGKPFGDASLTIEIAFSLAEGFFNREAVRNGEKEKPNKFLKYVVENDKKWKKAEKNGFYGLRCTGIAKRPDCNPVRPSMRVGFAKARGGDAEAKEKPTGEQDAPDSVPTQPKGRGDKVPTAERKVGTQPRMGTASDIERARVREAAADRNTPQPKVPRISTPPSGIDPKVRIEQLKREREERLREMRAARGLPPDPPTAQPDLGDPGLDEPLPDEELPEGDLPLDEGGELAPEDEIIDEALPEDDDPLRRLRPEEMPSREELLLDPDFDPER